MISAMVQRGGAARSHRALVRRGLLLVLAFAALVSVLVAFDHRSLMTALGLCLSSLAGWAAALGSLAAIERRRERRASSGR